MEDGDFLQKEMFRMLYNERVMGILRKITHLCHFPKKKVSYTIVYVVKPTSEHYALK